MPELLPGRLLDWAHEHKDLLVGELLRLTEVDAPTSDRDALETVATMLENTITEWGGELVGRWPTEAGPHLEARFGPKRSDRAEPLLLCHYDTVWPLGTVLERPPRLEAGLVHGPGVYDMRGGLVAGLGALRALQELGALSRPVSVLLTADEEQGSPTSQALITRRGQAASLVVVPEPAMPGGGLKTSRKGVCTYRLQTRGRAAHAGNEPTAGVSAVHALIRVLNRVLEFADEEQGTTVNVGVIQGGTLSNVVAEQASADVDIRVGTMTELDRLVAKFAELGGTDFGAKLEADQLEARPPMERTPAIAAAAARVQELARRLGLDISEGAVGGGSDANFIAPYNVPIIDGIGPEGGGAHALGEHVSVSSMLERCALIGLVLAEL